MVLVSTQLVTGMSTRNISWGGGKGGRCLGLTTLPPSRVDCLEIWDFKPMKPLGPVQGRLTIYYVIIFFSHHQVETADI